MGCFLACFGFSKKRKRRNPATKAPSGDHRRVSYVPLDSSVRIIGVDGGRESLKSELYRDKATERKRLKTRKKVSFNLNVQTYEPISTAYHFLDSYEEEEIGEKNVKETPKGRLSTSASERDSTTLRVGLFPSNYRYQNVRDSYEEEESELHDNDIDVVDEDDYYDDDEDSEIDEQQISREGFSEELCSASRNGESEYPDAKDNIRYVISVLSPVENLTQWKAAKAKAAAAAAAAPKHQKENTALFQQPRMPYSTRSNFNQSTKPLLQEVPVHASLSSWLNSQSTN